MNKIKFNIIVSRWANFYFFVKNVAECFVNDKKDYINLWKKELGEFSSEEKTALKEFKEVRVKYKSFKSVFEQAFFVAQNPLEELRNVLSAEEYTPVQKVFSILENKFNLLWNKDLPLLEEWQKELGSKINDSLLVEPVVTTLSAVFNSPSSKSEVEIYLLFSAPGYTGGGANIDDKSISVEISRYAIAGINHALGIIWHEVSHLCFEKKYFVPLLVNYFKEDNQSISLAIELTQSALLPNGILGQCLLNSPKSKILNTKIPQEYNDILLDTMSKYVEEKRMLDKEYIETILPAIQSL